MRVISAAVVALTATACGFQVNEAVGGDGGAGDATAPDVSPDACVTFSSQLDTCVGPSPSNLALVLDGSYVLDTETGELTEATAGPVAITTQVVTTTTNQVEVLAIFVGDLTLVTGATLRARGARPLAIVATGTVTLETKAIVDVGVGGAGARMSCPDAAGPGADDSNGAAGGGGGGLGGAGARGGNGDSDNGQSAGGVGGAAITSPSGPLGGCPGNRGGMGGDPGGPGGLGGGAVYVVSAVAIDVAIGAGLTAGGGGGLGGRKAQSQYGDAGGGGGGSGGMIWLEAPRVDNLGFLAANGGGGGEGSGNGSAGNPGLPGASEIAGANGGTGGSPTGADGGRGGAIAMVDGQSPTTVQAGGGGGGGGGVGFIRITSANAQPGNTSPAPN